MDKRFDVIVIGAGPAGCTAALYCELQGLDVCLLTGNPECEVSPSVLASQSVHPGLEALLKLLNLSLSLESISKGCYEGIWVNGTYFALGKDEDGPWMGFHLCKEELVHLMLQEIRNRSITVINDIVVDLVESNKSITGIVTMNGTRVSADNVLDCSGSTRFTTRKLDVERKIYSPSFICWSARTESIPKVVHEKLKTSLSIQNGFWEWLAPEYDSKCTWTRLVENEKPDLLPPDHLIDYVNKSKVSVYNMRWSMSRPVIAQGLLMCGDAGAIIDPSSGQGIFFAVYSAIMAGHVLVRSIQEPGRKRQFYEEYDQWFYENTEKKLKELKDTYLTNGFKW